MLQDGDSVFCETDVDFHAGHAHPPCADDAFDAVFRIVACIAAMGDGERAFGILEIQRIDFRLPEKHGVLRLPCETPMDGKFRQISHIGVPRRGGGGENPFFFSDLQRLVRQLRQFFIDEPIDGGGDGETAAAREVEAAVFPIDGDVVIGELRGGGVPRRDAEDEFMGGGRSVRRDDWQGDLRFLLQPVREGLGGFRNRAFGWRDDDEILQRDIVDDDGGRFCQQGDGAEKKNGDGLAHGLSFYVQASR